MLGELELRSGERQDGLVPGHACEALTTADFLGQGVAIAFVEQRFVIEEILLRRTAGHEQIDDAHRLWRVVGEQQITEG